MSEVVSKELQTFKCSWRTHSTRTDIRDSGEITVQARNLSHAIDVAKQRVYEQKGIGINNVVVYEVEEDFL